MGTDRLLYGRAATVDEAVAVNVAKHTEIPKKISRKVLKKLLKIGKVGLKTLGAAILCLVNVPSGVASLVPKAMKFFSLIAKTIASGLGFKIELSTKSRVDGVKDEESKGAKNAMLAFKLIGAILAVVAVIVACATTWGIGGIVVIPLSIAAISEILEFLAELAKVLVEDFCKDFNHRKIVLRGLDVTIAAFKLVAAVSKGIALFAGAAPIVIWKMIRAIASIADPALGFIKSILLVIDLKLATNGIKTKTVAVVRNEIRTENATVSDGAAANGSTEVQNGGNRETFETHGAGAVSANDETAREEKKSAVATTARAFQELANVSCVVSSVTACIGAWGSMANSILGVAGATLSVLGSAADGIEVGL
jgi:hypothetical protein